MLKSKGKKWMVPCRSCWKQSPVLWKQHQFWNQRELPANTCINFKNVSKYQQLIIVWTIFISTIYHVLCSGSDVELHLPFAFKLSLNCAGVLFCLKGFKVSMPQSRVLLFVCSLQWCWVTAKIIFSIVSYVLTSGHDLVTVWLSPQVCHQRQPQCQGSWLRPYWQAGPHCSRLLRTSRALGKEMEIVPSM